MSRWFRAGLCCTCTSLLLVLLAACAGEQGGRTGTNSDPSRAPQPAAPAAFQAPAGQGGYVDNTACAGCHPKEYESWLGSDHQLAMQEADDETVLADFAGETFTLDGVTMTFFRRGGQFFVNTAGADGIMADFQVTHVFGVRPLQQYLVAMPGGRLQCLVASWDDVDKRWYDLYPGEHIPAGSPYHWTGLYQNWNLMCAECHSTDLRENYDADSETYATTWAEINVSCQSCHGPGHDHVLWAEDGAALDRDKGLVVDLAGQDAPAQVETCAPCHSRRHRVSEEDGPGRPFLDDFMPALLEEGLYHADGQILDEVYVYGSFTQSLMYQKGVRCTDCHNPHTLELNAPGNGVCTSCHQQRPDSRFTSLKAARYDTREHHHHAEGSPGTACVACHMPATSYMVVDPRRDHSMRVPRPDLTVKLGTPNACNGCHQAETARWAANHVDDWYGSERSSTPHFAEAFAAGRSGRRSAAPSLLAVAGDQAQSAMVRATALALLARYEEGGAALTAALTAPEPLLRATAASRLQRLPPPELVAVLAPLLSDPVRAVRVAAVRTLAAAPPDGFSQPQREAFSLAMAELLAAEKADADTPGAHLNLGALAMAMGETEKAIAAYEKALSLDPAFLPARFNLANLFNSLQRNDDAEKTLRRGIERAPGEGELYYSLGLILAEGRHMEEAAGALATAVDLLPGRARVQFNYALVMQSLGQVATAENALLAAHRLDEQDVNVVHALAILYAQNQEWDGAQAFAEKLVDMAPREPAAAQLLERILQAKAEQDAS